MKIEAVGEFLVVPTQTMGQNIATLAPVLGWNSKLESI